MKLLEVESPSESFYVDLRSPTPERRVRAVNGMRPIPDQVDALSHLRAKSRFLSLDSSSGRTLSDTSNGQNGHKGIGVAMASVSRNPADPMILTTVPHSVSWSMLDSALNFLLEVHIFFRVPLFAMLSSLVQ